MEPKSLSVERLRILAEKNGWTQTRAEGYHDGSLARSRGQKPSGYAMVGTDDYCRGYRDGYFARESPKDGRTSLSDPVPQGKITSKT